MAREALFEWQGEEYEHNPKSADWYWALGIIATAATIAAFLFGNILLALLVVVAAGTIALHAAKKPSTHTFQITEDGLIIGNELYPYVTMRSFAMLEYIEGDKPPLLSIKTSSWFTPHLLIPLNDIDADLLYAHFLAHVDEGEHQHTIVDVVSAWLGF